ncbi:uncharacterized protein [Acropora muricata]|uniref:uncharacterized protein isoform X2 n=1 Tax=Acropora muricata TaxID=159855 RepID=UPI0034E4A144
MSPPYSQQFGPVQPPPAAPIGALLFDPQCGTLHAAPIGGYLNTRPEPPSHPNPQPVAPRPPPITDEEANTSDNGCDWNYICFDYSVNYKWYDLRGKVMIKEIN